MIRNPPNGFLMQEMQVRYPGWEETPGEETATPLQDPCLGSPVDRGAWRAALRGVARSRM